jgi:hypothetical protein
VLGFFIAQTLGAAIAVVTFSWLMPVPKARIQEYGTAISEPATVKT